VIFAPYPPYGPYGTVVVTQVGLNTYYQVQPYPPYDYFLIDGQ